MYTINIYKLHNFVIAGDHDSLRKEIFLKFSITLYDLKTKSFCSRTYKSASHPVIVEDNDALEKYYHDPFWVGFYGHEDLDLMNTVAVIEVTHYRTTNNIRLEHDKDNELIEGNGVLGFTMINLGTFMPEYLIYHGSSRNVSHSAALIAVGKLFLEAEVQQIHDKGCVQ